MKGKSFGLAFVLILFCVMFSCTSDDAVESEKPGKTDVSGKTTPDTVIVRDTVYERDTVYVPDTTTVVTEPCILE